MDLRPLRPVLDLRKPDRGVSGEGDNECRLLGVVCMGPVGGWLCGPGCRVRFDCVGALEVVGIDRILFSTDYPYQYRPGGGPRQFIEQLPVSHDDKEKIAHANWERLTRGIRR